ncbi:MAG TPA: ABC transporter permease [Chryseosolibacter sp.]|nr:ABC transporter permease [Chryseosolibacter sp.]
MFRNFATVALRNFFRQKFYSFINLLGLASGLACTLFIYLWVKDELEVDKFHKDSDRIFHVVSNLKFSDEELITWTITPGPLADDIRDHVPEVELAVRTYGAGAQLIQHEEKGFMERGYFADPGFFDLFSFPVRYGAASRDPNDVKSIAISQALAGRLFGNDEPIGKIVKLNNRSDFTVAAVYDNPPSQSSLQFDFVLPFEIARKNRGDGFNWGNYDYPLYLKLRKSGDATAVMEKINQRAAARARAGEESVQFYVQRFGDFYLNSFYENGKPAGGRIKYVKIFSIVAVFILLIACINFMNMATARAANRSKEVGIRKVVGAQRKSLIIQFIGESMLVSTIAMLIGIAVVYTLLPVFNALVGKQIVLDFSDPVFLLSIVGIIALTSVMAGSYPAFFLSAFQPVRVLKSSVGGHAGSAAMRKGLVLFQFVLTVILIASSIVVYRQIQFIRTKNVGYNRESVITFGLLGSLYKEFGNFKNELEQLPLISYVSRADQSLVQVNNQNSSVGWPGKPENMQPFFRTVVVDYDYLETMGVTLKQGRFFSREHHDTSMFVVTERAVEVMGLQDPVGQVITQWGMPGKIIGVAGDFHSRSLHEAIDPIVFLCKPEWAGSVFIRLEGAELQAALDAITTAYKKYNPQYPFSYSFVDEDFEKLYKNEKVTGSLAISFTVMAIIISGLGLLALAAYASEKRKKEISIRKTLGATVSSIVSLMSKEFLQLAMMAAVIGCPLAYLLMKKFLQAYAYHTELSWELFAMTALSVLIVCMGTVIFQVTRAARTNPVDALRNE